MQLFEGARFLRDQREAQRLFNEETGENAEGAGKRLCRGPLLFVATQAHADDLRYSGLLHGHAVNNVGGMHHPLRVRYQQELRLLA
jgi:hypothetical protein